MLTASTLRLGLAMVAVLAQAAGCATSSAPAPGPEVGLPVATGGDPVAPPDTFDEARSRWAAAGIADYRFTLTRSCFCPAPDYTGPFEVTVRGGEVASVRLGGAPVEADRGLSVEALFDLLEDAYAQGAETVEVTYDPEAGFPASLYVDYEAMMADEEIGYTVTDLEAL